MGNSIDREKVIKAVEEAFDLVHSDYIGTYDFDETEWEQNKVDAIALLKEQEAVRPILTPWIVNDDGEVTVYKMECGKCGIQFYYEDQKYCSECGTPILWEGR